MLILGYPFAAELLQQESVKKSQSRFEQTVLEATRNRSNPIKKGNKRWDKLQSGDRERLRNLGFYPASLSRGTPGMQLKTLEGGVKRLTDYRGKWILMNFWATWCPPCRMEMPSLDQLQKKFKDEPLSVVTVNVQQNNPTIRQFQRNYGFTLPVLLDKSGKVAKAYGVVGLPETWLITPREEPVAKIDGPLDWHSKPVRHAFEKLFN
jgi:thiol-disulfide isomerase/thioredoxin